MAKGHVNNFVAGVRPDRSLLFRQGNELLDALNLRLMQKESSSLAATDIDSTLPLDNLTAGFLPLGSAEYQGVSFILSYNDQTEEVELGTFPAPRLTAEGYDEVYRPLQNYTLENYAAQLALGCEPLDIQVQTLPFRTEKLTWPCCPVWMELKEETDGSVNIYLSNRKQAWVVFNSGFTLQNGLRNGRYTGEQDIVSGIVNGINESENHPIVKLQTLQSDGALQAGHYFVYVRYADDSFNVTSFLGESRPIPIFFTRGQIAVGGQGGENTGKSMILDITGLNPFAAFIEIGWVYYGDAGIVQGRIIDNRYAIGGNTSLQIKVTGLESQLEVKPSEITSYKPSDAVVCQTFTQQNNVLYLGNISGPRLDHPDLRHFVCALELGEGSLELRNPDTIKQGQTDHLYGINEQDIHSRLGYWSGESYIFGIRPVFRGGFTGLVYPMKGFDNYSGTPVDQNDQSIFRFSSAAAVNPWDGNIARAKTIRVTVTPPAQNIYNNSQWLQNNLIGLYIVRAERNKNILHQGILMQCFNGNLSLKDAPGAPIQSQETRSTSFCPMFEPATYGWWMPTAPPAIPGTLNVIPYYLHPEDVQTSIDYVEQGKMGILSTDYYIQQQNTPDNVYIQRIGTTNYFNDWEREKEDNIDRSYIQAPNGYLFTNPNSIPFQLTQPPPPYPVIAPTPPDRISDQELAFIGYNMTGVQYEDGPGFESQAINVPLWDAGTYGSGFTSAFDEGRNVQNDGLYWQERSIPLLGLEYNISMPLRLPAYTALEDAPNINPTGAGGYNFTEPWERSLVNVCFIDPQNLSPTTLYDFKNTLFSDISSYQTIGDFIAAGSQEYLGGDCIIARSYIKVWNGSVEAFGEEISDLLANRADPGRNEDNSPTNGWGHWISYVGEHNCNPNYRNEQGRNVFYPATSIFSPGRDFSWKLDSPESRFLTDGYKRFLSPRQVLGIDLLSRSSTNRFPTRIRPSIRHIMSAVRDGYRQFTSGEEKDYDYRSGEIRRLISWSDLLYSVQDTAVNLHPTNERVTQQGDAGSVTVLGEGLKLPEYRRIITDKYGCQHPFSIVIADGGIYMIDFKRRHIIKVTGEGYELHDVQAEYNDLLRDVLSTVINGSSNASNRLQDNHSCGVGIHAGYHRRHNEISFTFLLPQAQHTICIEEKMNLCLGRRSYIPRWYGSLEEDLLSFFDGQLWAHDKGADKLVIYGDGKDWYIEVPISPEPGITKHFNNHVIGSNERTFASIHYRTQHQTADQDPFIDPNYWYKPTYRFNKWKLPIRRAESTSGENNAYAVPSPLMGRYLITKLVKRGNLPLTVDQLQTFYNIVTG